MSIESIKARMEEHDRQRERFRSSQQVQMLNAIEYDAPKVERQRIAKKALDAALTELEAQE